MNFKNRSTQRVLTVWLAGLLLFTQTFAQTAALAPAQISDAEKELTAQIKIDTIKEITAALSADEMQGRGTMQPGGEKAANWIADRMKTLGLNPLGDKGSYLQKIDFKETVYTPETVVKVGDDTLQFGSDYAELPYSKGDKNTKGDLVFIGYGLVAKAQNLDSLAGINIKGKILVMLDGPPAGISEENWDKAKLRWDIRINLIQGGAAGIIIISHGREKESHETRIDYMKRRQISLVGEEERFLEITQPFLLASKSGAEKLFAKSQTSLKDALASAETAAFKPVVLNQKASIVTKTKSTKGVSYNVAGVLEGSDPTLKSEAVLFSAHYDGYGVENDRIYHAAADNALGVAEMLSVAEAYSKMAVKPKRSMIFLAVTAEEYGLYGSKYWSKKPTWDIKKVTADLNLDGIGTEVYAPVKTFVGFGAEHSTLGAMLTDVSSAFGIKVIPDPMPDEKIFLRSDHYSFVERGVPALMLLGAPEGDPQKWIDRSKEWEKTDYHQPTDTIQPNWAWEGAKTVADVMGIMGLRVSDTATMPAWLQTSRFGKLERGNTKDLPEEK